MSGEKEGAWAREYRQGRAAQVEQQRIANLIALSASPLVPMSDRHLAAARATKALLDDAPDTGSTGPVTSKEGP